MFPQSAVRVRTAVCLPLSFALLACSSAREPQSPQQEERLAQLHSAGIGVPLVLHPIRVLGRPDPRCAQVLGLVLEQQGMPSLAMADAAFAVAADATWDAVPQRFGAFVREHATADGTGAMHLYGEFLGTPQQGPTEVRFVVVDARGEVLLTDRQTPSDRAFRRTAGRDPDPLGCAALVADRLFTLADWQRQPGAVRDGQFAQLWRRMSGAPDASEVAAMAERLAALRERIATARFTVLPTLVGGTAGGTAADTARLTAGLTQRFGCRANAAVAEPPLAVAADSNEQKRLWDLARGLAAAAPAQAADADYLLVVDAGFDGTRVGYVHVVVCTAAGAPVVVDWQNDQHPMLQRAAPASVAAAEQFALDRLERLLR